MRAASRTSSMWIAGAAVLVLSGCGDATPEWHGEGPVRWRELLVRGDKDPGFVSRGSKRTGIGFTNDPTIEALTANQHLANGAGVAIGDVNGDALPDVFLTNTRGANGLFINRGRLRFEDASDASGVRFSDRHPTGAVMADVDGDRDLDLLISAMGSPITLLRNDGSGHFTEDSRAAGFSLVRAGSSMTLADIDGDADLDLYAANYRLLRAADVFSSEDRRETPVLDQRDGEWVVNEKYRDFYRVVLGPEGVMTWEFGEADDLYVNQGDGTFVREPVSGARFRDRSGRPTESEPQEWGLSARFRDLDADGDPDLYVANDFESADQIWINDGTGAFDRLGAPAIRKTSQASMSVAFGDVDGDGTTDVFVADMLAVSSRRRNTQVPMLRERPSPPGIVDSVAQVNRNTLQLGSGDGTYVEVARQAGVDASGWTWGSEFLDVDLDGDLDLVTVNGHVWDPLDVDTGDRLRMTQATASADWRDVINRFPPLRLPNRAFRNRGDGTFEPVDGGWGVEVGEDISHGLAVADLDGDGDSDIVVNRLGDPALVLENRSMGARVAVRLVGLAPNTAAVGAVIRLLGGPSPQSREIGAGGLYLSHSEGMASFAAGDGDGDGLFLEVLWPSGTRTVVDDVRGNRLYEISETGGSDAGTPSTDGAPSGTGNRQTSRGGASQVAPPPLFVDGSSAFTQVHADRAFNPGRGQPLLPRRLDRLGPGVTWTDADGDGDPDLVVGSGAGGSVTFIENTDGVLGPARRASPALDYDVTTLLPESDGLLSGVANYEASNTDEAQAVAPAYRTPLRGPLGRGEYALTSNGASSGPMASADMDGDGDLDVFIGGRVYAAAYPIPPASHVYLRGTNGALAYDSVVSAGVAASGLVSGATFTDIDDDGDADLALAVDWGPVRLYMNERGRFIDVTQAWGLADYSGWWNGITAGDLDGDGRMDLVVTSWGRNTGLAASPERPLRAYWADFDRSGTLDVILAQRDDRLGTVAPLEPFARISAGLPYVRSQRVPTYGAFADASLEEIVGPALEGATMEQATTLDHTVFMNRGRRFEAIPLPAAAQRAPAFGVAVADFDGDGREDVLLAQNFFENEIGNERHDAGRGLLLVGDGAGGLTPVPARTSGVDIAGDMRGLAVADYDGDGRLDVAIGVNAGPAVVLHNRGASPGLRVRLEGGAANPFGVGARLRVVYEDGLGPAREIRRGSGYWSVDDAVTVLGLRGEPRAVEVRWPDGTVQRTDVPSGVRYLAVRRDVGGEG